MEALTLQQFTYRLTNIEVALVSGGNKTKFDAQPQLDNAIIFNIRALNAADITITPNTGSTPIAVADFAKAGLLLMQGTEQKIDSIPLPLFHDMQNATPTPFIRNPFIFNRLGISWTKCYVTLPGATWSQSQVLTLIVSYAYPEDFGFATVDQYYNSLQSRPAIEVANRQ